MSEGNCCCTTSPFTPSHLRTKADGIRLAAEELIQVLGYKIIRSPLTVPQASKLKDSAPSLQERRAGPLVAETRIIPCAQRVASSPLMHRLNAGKRGYQQHHFFPNINYIEPINTKLNQEVSSSCPYLPYSPRIMCMPKKTNARATLSVSTTLQRVINNSKRLMHRVSCVPFLPCFLQAKDREWRATAQRKTSLSALNNSLLALWRDKHEQALFCLTREEQGRVDGCTG